MNSTKKALLFFSCFATCGIAEINGAPYPRSSVITGIRFDQSTLTKAASGSDQFNIVKAVLTLGSAAERIQPRAPSPLVR